MKIVYNPKSGAPISQFIHRGIMVEPHFNDGFQKKDGAVANGLMQYEDDLADSLVETYEFLTIMDEKSAKKILDRPPLPELKCEEPGCEFKTVHKLALAGHSSTHRDYSSSAPVVSPDLIPVAGGKKVQSLAEKKKMMDNRLGADIPNGTDKDGVDWYGDGLEVTNNSQDFQAMRSNGRGHFSG